MGHPDDIKDTIDMIEDRSNIKTEGELNDFLGTEIIRDGKKEKCWLLQQHTIKKLEKKFEFLVGTHLQTSTPGTPRQVLTKHKTEEELLSKDDHDLYRSGVGTLLYMLKHSRMELSNPIRELSKFMQLPSNKHMKELYRVVAWILKTKNVGLKMEPKYIKKDNGEIKWELKGICDTTWGSDPEDGRSVTGFILYFMGVPISWKSKTQKHVTLSSSEAEYVGASELVKDIMFVLQILETLGIVVELPINVYMDNIGAIQMARNNQSGTATRHINFRYYYCREVHGTLIRLIFVRSEENESDILTKNSTKQEFEHHAPKLIEEVPLHLIRK